MRYAIYEINPRKSYGITIGSRVKPDSQFREQVKSQIDKAMDSFERNPEQGYGIAIVPDWDSAESGSSEIPSLNYRGQYLIFALLYSPDPDSAESLSNQEIELYREEIGEMLSGIAGETRAALVLLRDCSVSVIETDRGKSDLAFAKPTVFKREDIFGSKSSTPPWYWED